MIKHFFSRLWLRVAVRIFKTINKVDWLVSSPYESTCAFNCRQLIKDPASELLICPVSNKRYIKNERTGLFIIIHPKKVEIINHKFYYPIDFSIRGQRKLVQIFDGNVGYRRQAMEDEIKINVTTSLSEAFAKI